MTNETKERVRSLTKENGLGEPWFTKKSVVCEVPASWSLHEVGAFHDKLYVAVKGDPDVAVWTTQDVSRRIKFTTSEPKQ